MEVEVLHIEDCPSWTTAVANVRAALDVLHLYDAEVAPRLIATEEDAAAFAFAGSPTITVNGVDLFPSDDGTVELACRIYRTPHGLSGSPSTEELVEALRTVIAGP